MEHRQARAIFSKRKAMVEPVFGALRQAQGLGRFRRRGLKAVKREFALHIMAYNLDCFTALRQEAMTCSEKFAPQVI
jgi:hypothetical protein